MYDSKKEAEVDQFLQNSGLCMFVVTDKSLNIIKANDLFYSTFKESAASYFKNKPVFEQQCQQLSHGKASIVTGQPFQPFDSANSQTFKWEIRCLVDNGKTDSKQYVFIGVQVQNTAADHANPDQNKDTIFQNVQDAVIVTDINFRITGFNKGAENIYQLTPEQTIGQTTDILNHQFEQTSTELAAKELLESDYWTGEVYLIRSSDQQKIYLHSIVCAVFDKEKNKIGYVAINRDVSDLRTTEQVLFSKIKQQSDYLEAFAPGVIIQDKEGKILFCNSSSEKILGFTKEQMLGVTAVDPSSRCIKKDLSPFPGDEHPAMVCLRTGKPVQNVIMGIYKPDASLLWININSNPVINKEGKTEAVVSIFADITAERNAFLQLEASEKRMRTALTNVGDNAWEHNFKTNQFWFSHPVNPFIGYTEDEFRMASELGTNLWWHQTHKDDRELLIQNDREYKKGIRDSHSLEYRIYHKDGSMRWVLDKGVVIDKDELGKPIRIIGTHTDISNEKALQIELLKQKEKKRKDIVEAVLQAQEMEREQIANELHEGIAQVLSSVKLMLETPAADATATEEKLRIAKERIGEMIQDLKQISQNINSSTLKLLGLAQTIDDFITSATSHAAIFIATDFTHFKPTIPIDYSIQLAILRILQEVIRNIIRHSEATVATVELHSSKSFVQLFIRDNGKGFAQKDGYYGLGIKNIINRAEQYNGNVEIVSAPGKGCLLQIILPVSIQ